MDAVNEAATARRILQIYVATPFLVASGSVMLAVALFWDQFGGRTVAIGVLSWTIFLFSVGLLCSHYVALQGKQAGKEDSASAPESIASQDLSALARSVPPLIASTRVVQEGGAQVLRIGIRDDPESDHGCRPSNRAIETKQRH